MAGEFEGRVLRKDISKDIRVASLETTWAKLFYSWCIPHLDSMGRAEADPVILKSMIFPRENYATPKRIAVWCLEIHEAGLYFWYEVDGERFFQCPTSEKNLYHKKGRERTSKFPTPLKEEYEKWLKEVRNSHARSCPDTERHGCTSPTHRVGVGKGVGVRVGVGVISSQITDLLKQFPESIQNSIKTYWDRARMKNKSQTITDGRKLTMLRELWNSFSQCKDQSVFEKALEGALKYDAPNINYLNAIIRSEKCPKP